MSDATRERLLANPVVRAQFDQAVAMGHDMSDFEPGRISCADTRCARAIVIHGNNVYGSAPTTPHEVK